MLFKKNHEENLIDSNVYYDIEDNFNDDEVVVRKKRGFLGILGTFFLVILFMILFIIIALNALIKAPDTTSTLSISNIIDTIDDQDEQYNGSAETPDTKNSNKTREAGIYTFLIVGFDKVADNTDTIMLGKMDTNMHTMNIINIPRDTYCNISSYIKKINGIYADAGGEDEGIEALLDEVSNICGYVVDSYAFIDINAAAKLVDIIGGVEYNVPVDMHYEDPTQDLTIDIDKGLQTLNGEDFVKVMRYRDTYQYGDLGRIAVQQDLLKTLAKQTLKAGNIKNIGKLIRIYEKYVDTNLTSGNLYFYLQQFLMMDIDSIEFKTLPNTPLYQDEVSYVFINQDEWLDLLNDTMNPFTEDITSNDIDIVSAESMGGAYASSDIDLNDLEAKQDNEEDESILGEYEYAYRYTSDYTD